MIRIWRALPGWLQAGLRSVLGPVLRPLVLYRMAHDWPSFGKLRALWRAQAAQGLPRRPQGQVELRLAALGGQAITVRAGTTDVRVLWNTFVAAEHLPPTGIRPYLIFDLGAHIGLTMAHMATLYPETRVVGVELNHENAKLCIRNVAVFGKRCEVVEAAVWWHDGEVRYETEPGSEYGFYVAPQGSYRARAVTLQDLVAANTPPGSAVDYVKMDIEGAERELLTRNTDWASRVRSIKVEVHPPYAMEECIRDLERLGFAAHVDSGHPALVSGYNRRTR
jgi:FkbM family methyltransferase